MKHMHPVYTVLIASLFFACTTDQADYRQRLSKLHDKIDHVSTALENSEGFPAKAGHIDLQVAKFFAEYIDWELDHPEIMKDVLIGNETYGDTKFSKAVKKDVGVDLSERERRFQFHIEHELNSSMDILEQALARLEQDAEWPEVKNINWEQVVFSNGYFRLNGQPVFSGGFNILERSMIDATKYPDLAEKDRALTSEFLKQMQKLGVGILSTGATVTGLVNEDGSINKSQIQDLVQTIQDYDQMGFKVDVLFGWSGNRETLEKLWPGITEYYGHFVHFDIDYPGVEEMVTRVMAELMPALQNMDAIVSWDMANEPGFSFDMWSPHSLQKYHAWLAGQYTTVKQLNAVWKTGYAGFGAIPLPKEKPQEQCSPGEWHDRVTFHSFRVTTFFEHFRNEILKYVPDAVIHLKAQDNSSLGPRPGAVTDGIDREMLTPLVNMQGVDTRPLPVTEPRMAVGDWDGNRTMALNYDGSFYGFHWLGQSFLYDYLTSFEPRRPVIDFEYHAFSINAIRIPDMRQSHPRAALWLAHLHGLISNVTWYWHRRYGPNPFPSNNYMMWLYGSVSTQPLIAAEYFQTMLQLNAFAEEVAAMASDTDRPVRLFVSKPSFIQNQAHISALHRAYEGACFSGKRIGFVTEQMLVDEGMPEGCKVIIIPDAEYVSASALQVLKQAGQQGAQLVRFGERQTAYDAHGMPHAPGTIAFLKDVPVYEYASAPDLSMEFESLLAPLSADLPVQISVVNGNGAFGVMNRQAEVNGNQVILLVNVSDKPVQVKLQSNDGRVIDGYDMLNGEAVQGIGIALPFQDVRLIKVSL
jgi:hypothetical protein